MCVSEELDNLIIKNKIIVEYNSISNGKKIAGFEIIIKDKHLNIFWRGIAPNNDFITNDLFILNKIREYLRHDKISQLGI